MTIVSFLNRRRRLLILAAATVALHYLTIDWLGTRLGPQPRHTAPGALVTAQLKLALPQRVAPAEPVPELAALAPSAPRPKRAPRPKPAPQPVPEPAAPAPSDSAAEPAMAASSDAGAAAADASAAADAGAAAADGAASASASASATASTAASTAQDGAAQAQAAAAAAAAAAQAASAPPPPADAIPNLRRYKVHLPPSADFDLDVARVDADGTKWTGVASMAWHTDGSRYTLSVEAGISMLITRLNLLVLHSEGLIDDYGIAPVTATEKRRGRAQTATHFNRDDGSISFSASERRYPLLTGAQDKATVPFQLGAIGRANLDQFATDIDILVGEDKEANVFRFQLVGEELLDTRMGKIVTWHLTRPPKPGTYSSRLDIWLAPSRNWYPLQIRNTEASGALTTQTVSKITMLPQ
jgi:hypothetical protein